MTNPDANRARPGTGGSKAPTAHVTPVDASTGTLTARAFAPANPPRFRAVRTTAPEDACVAVLMAAPFPETAAAIGCSSGRCLVKISVGSPTDTTGSVARRVAGAPQSKTDGVGASTRAREAGEHPVSRWGHVLERRAEPRIAPSRERPPVRPTVTGVGGQRHPALEWLVRRRDGESLALIPLSAR